MYILYKMGNIPIKRAGEVLKACLNDEQLFELQVYSSFFKNWKSIVGEKIACHSKIKDIRNKIVVIEAEHPSWIQLIRIRESEILKKIQQKYTDLDIRGISICLRDTIDPQGTRFEPPAKAPEEEISTPIQGKRSVPRGENPELDKVLEKLKAAIETKSS
jgi:hypothetical protein